jgi:DUF1009 family protein
MTLRTFAVSKFDIGLGVVSQREFAVVAVENVIGTKDDHEVSLIDSRRLVVVG